MGKSAKASASDKALDKYVGASDDGLDDEISFLSMDDDKPVASDKLKKQLRDLIKGFNPDLIDINKMHKK